MADEVRSVVVRLSMEAANYIREAQRAGAVGADAMGKVEKSAKRASAAQEDLGRKAGRLGLLAAAGAAAFLVSAAKFDKAMSTVRAATHESAANMDQLRQAALDAGKQTQFSATEAADAVTQLAKAGVSTRDIIGGGLTGALDLAAAGELGVGDAAEYMATALTQFQLEGKEASHVADLLAAGAGKAQGEVSDMALALSYAGVPAAQLGVSIEETAGTIALFAKNGIIGERAGTSLRGMLASLTSPSTVAAKEMEKLGLNVFDAQGKFIGFNGVADQLQATLGSATDQERAYSLGRIFGNEQLQAANVLYREGADGVQKWTAAVNDQGYAAETASLKMDNLLGDLERLKGSLETALIGGGEGSQGPLRKLVQGLNSVVDGFNKLPPAAQSATTGLLAGAALIGGSLWLGSKLVRGIADTRNSLNELGVTASGTAGKIARIGATAGSILLAAQAANALTDALGASNSVNTADIARDLEAIANGGATDSLGKLAGALEGVNEAGAGTVSALTNIGTLGTFDSSFERNAATIEGFDQQLASLVEGGHLEEAAAGFQAIRDAAAANGGVSDSDVVKQFDAYSTALENVDKASTEAAASTYTYANAQEAAGRSVSYTAEQVKAAREAYADSVKAARDSASSFLDISENADEAKVSLSEWVKQMEDQARALEQFTANVKRAGEKGVKQGLIDYLEQLGPVGALRMRQLANATDAEIGRANRAWKRGQDAAHDYEKATVVKPVELRADATDVTEKVDLAERLFNQMPKSTNTDLKVDNSQALAGARAVQAAIDFLHDKTITLRVLHQESRLPVAPHVATGGLISGPGTATSDSIPAYLSNGEYVMRAAAVDKYGPAMFHRMNTLSLAAGGPVSRAPSRRRSSPDLDWEDFGAILQALADTVEVGGKDIRQAFHQLALAKTADEVRNDVRQLRDAIKEAGGHWTKAMRDQADHLVELAKQHDLEKAVGKALRGFDVAITDGADAVRNEIQGLKHAIREAGGTWTAAMDAQSKKLIQLSADYERQSATLAASEQAMDDLMAQQAAFAEQVGQSLSHDPFGQGLDFFDLQAGANTNDTQAFNEVLQQLAAQGLDGPLFEQLAASSDLATASQLLATGPAGIEIREQAFAAMIAAQQRLGGFAGNEVFGEAVSAAAQAVRDGVLAQVQLTQQMGRVEDALERNTRVMDDMPRQNKEATHDGSKSGTKQGVKEAFGNLAGRS